MLVCQRNSYSLLVWLPFVRNRVRIRVMRIGPVVDDPAQLETLACNYRLRWLGRRTMRMARLGSHMSFNHQTHA